MTDQEQEQTVADEQEQTVADDHDGCESGRACVSRRNFMLATGAGALSTTFLPGFLKTASGAAVSAQLSAYPRTLVAKVSELKVDQPLQFRYPQNHLNNVTMIVKTGVPSLGGVGPDGDIVAFSSICTHMGGNMMGKRKRRQKYQPDTKMLGPCPLHLTTFDLTRAGIVVAGQATQNLPQIVLEMKGDQIYATGVLGLVFGVHDNLAKL